MDEAGTVVKGAVVTSDEVAAFVRRLAFLDPDVDDAERVEQLGALEAVKAAAAAAQARVAAAFDESQRAAQQAAGVPRGKLGAGIAEQVALARRASPSQGSRHLGLAKALVHEMPHTLAALSDGRVSEWRATLVVQATAVLMKADRQAVDARLAGRLEGRSDRAVLALARKAAYEQDPKAFVEHGRRAVEHRRVTIRPALDLMTHLSAFLPMAQGIATYAALRQDAESTRAAGDERSLGQIMADELVQRVTGQATARAVPVQVNLVMTDAALLGVDDTPATAMHYGPMPAGTARDLVRDTAADDAAAWVRRLLTDPITGVVTGAEKRRREFPAAVRRVVVARDEWCRTPWCGAPIRHIDHITSHAKGGRSVLANAQGLCVRCNQVKEVAGWRALAMPSHDDPTRVRTTTPTSHSYDSTAPPGWVSATRSAAERQVPA